MLFSCCIVLRLVCVVEPHPSLILLIANYFRSKHVKNVYFILVPFFSSDAYFFGNLDTNGAKLRAVNQCFNFVADAFGSYCVCHDFLFLLLLMGQM